MPTIPQGDLFRKLTTHVPGMIFQFKRDRDGSYSIPFTTPNIQEYFECSPEDVVSDFSPVLKVIHQDDTARLIKSIEDSAKTLTEWQCEYRVQFSDDSVKWYYGHSTPEKLDDGSIVWHGFNTDITKRKEDEEKLQENIEELKNLNKLMVGRELKMLELKKQIAKLKLENKLIK